MGLTGDFAGLRRLERDMQDLARLGGPSQRSIASAVGREVRGVFKQEFATGVGPDGPWKKTKRGRQALESRKLAPTIHSEPVSGGVFFRSHIPWLEAHQEGHVFGARKSGGQSLFFDERGRLLKGGRLSGSRIRRIKFVSERIARPHAVGQRTLPARPMRPVNGLPRAWSDAINRGAAEALRRWYAKAGR